MLSYSQDLVFNGKVVTKGQGFEVSDSSIERGTTPTFVAPSISACHVVIIREAVSQTIWMAHVTEAEVKQLSSNPFINQIPAPAYIQLTPQFQGQINENCPIGQIDIIVVDKLNGSFSEQQLKEKLSPECKIGSLSVYRYNNFIEGNSYQYQVAYDVNTNALTVSSENDRIPSMQIKNAFRPRVAVKTLDFFSDKHKTRLPLKRELDQLKNTASI